MLGFGLVSAFRGHNVEEPGLVTALRGHSLTGETQGPSPRPALRGHCLMGETVEPGRVPALRGQSGGVGGEFQPLVLMVKAGLGPVQTLRRDAIARLWESGSSYVKESRRMPNWGHGSRLGYRGLLSSIWG